MRYINCIIVHSVGETFWPRESCRVWQDRGPMALVAPSDTEDHAFRYCRPVRAGTYERFRILGRWAYCGARELWPTSRPQPTPYPTNTHNTDTVTITMRYLYSAPYRIGQQRWTRKKLIKNEMTLESCDTVSDRQTHTHTRALIGRLFVIRPTDNLLRFDDCSMPWPNLAKFGMCPFGLVYFVIWDPLNAAVIFFNRSYTIHRTAATHQMYIPQVRP